MCKRESLNQIIQTAAPDIVALCETKLGSKSKPKITGYETEYMNFKTGKEGLLVAAKEGTFVSMDKVTSENVAEDKNILAVQVKYPNRSIRVIVAHAPQETDKQENRERFFHNMKLETERAELNGESILIVGDMNGRIAENGKLCSSPNGEYLNTFINEHSLRVANFHTSASGKWTRIQQTKVGEEKSAIDYILLDESLYCGVKEVLIDESKLLTPYWVTTRKGIRSVISSDHCAMTLKIGVELGSIEEPKQDTKIWKITSAGLLKYKELTSTRSLFLGTMLEQLICIGCGGNTWNVLFTSVPCCPEKGS